MFLPFQNAFWSNTSMSIARKFGMTAAVVASLVLAGCAAEPQVRGYLVDQQALSQVKVGSSAEHVILVLGTPSIVSTVGGKGYYYVSQKASQMYQFMQPSITEQNVVAVHLDARNKVDRIAHYGIQDGVLFDFISRKTPTGGDELTFVRQLLKATNLNPIGGAAPSQPGM